MEFVPIETQEQFDEMVKDRVERAKSAGAKDARKEFETQLKDLEQLKESVTAKETEIGTLKAKITDLEAEKKTSGESYQSMQKELSAVKLSALKQRIAIDAGIPLEMADRLNGEDEESIKEDAEKVKGFWGAKHVAPSFKTEEVPEDPAEAGFREMAQLFERK